MSETHSISTKLNNITNLNLVKKRYLPHDYEPQQKSYYSGPKVKSETLSISTKLYYTTNHNHIS